MIDVLVLVKSKAEELDEKKTFKIQECKKYLSNNIKDFLNNKEINNEIVNSYKPELAIDIKCFLTLEIEISNESILEIYSSKTSNKSSELCDEILKDIGDIAKINYDKVSFEDNDLPYGIAKIFMKLYINIENDDIEENNILRISKAISEGIGAYLEIDEEKEKNKISIVNYEIENKNKAKQYSKDRGLDNAIIELIDYYWELAKNHGGVDPLIAYIQAILSMGENKIEYRSYNPGGIRDSKLNSSGMYEYKKFQSLKDGIEAHLDHLALFAGAEGYPKSNSKDPRHFKYLFGSCKTVDELSGTWDIDKEYGEKITTIYNEIIKVVDFSNFKEVSFFTEGVEDKIDKFAEKLISMGNLLETLVKEYSLIYSDLDIIKKEIGTIKAERGSLINSKEELEKKVIKQKTVIKDILNVIGESLEKK